MFRTQDNIPEIYVNESRDFQLLCRIKDAIQGAVKYNIDSLRHLNNTLEMNSTLLPLLKSKVGFFKEERLSEDQLRYLLAGFPFLVKYKGSRKAIESAVYLWFRVNQIGGELISVIIDNINYEINLNIDTTPKDTALLDSLFTYLIPSGYIIKYNFASDVSIVEKYPQSSKFAAFIVLPNAHSKVRGANVTEDMDITDYEQSTSEFHNRTLGTVGFTQVYNPLEEKD